MDSSASHKTNKQTGVFTHPAGFELIEILVTLGLLSFLLIVMLSSNAILQLQDNAYHRVLARQLIAEESEALRNGSYAYLTNRTDKPFMDVAHNAGSWKVETPSNPCLAPAPCSGGNALRVNNVTGTNNPSRAVVPAGRLGDGTYDFHFQPQAASASGWAAGMYLRYRDSQNHYLLQATADTLALQRVSRGVVFSLWSVSQTFTPDTWYQLTVVADGLVFDISLNGTKLVSFADAISIFDPPLDWGQFVLHAANGVVAEFDDVMFTNRATTPTTLMWNFDGSNERIGESAYGWKRLGPHDLPQGTTLLTISNAQSGFTDLKRIDLSVRWYERGSTTSLGNTFYINQYSVAP